LRDRQRAAGDETEVTWAVARHGGRCAGLVQLPEHLGGRHAGSWQLEIEPSQARDGLAIGPDWPVSEPGQVAKRSVAGVPQQRSAACQHGRDIQRVLWHRLPFFLIFLVSRPVAGRRWQL
jgi:hypothetical protein